jgi:hypothetical protein
VGPAFIRLPEPVAQGVGNRADQKRAICFIPWHGIEVQLAADATAEVPGLRRGNIAAVFISRPHDRSESALVQVPLRRTHGGAGRSARTSAVTARLTELTESLLRGF